MQVFALVGPSGTGKSHRASYVAYQYQIPLLIDDGLLIAGSTVLAGKSAKREVTRIGAIKRAIFHDPLHAAEVRAKILASGAERILILGTSEKMVEKITQRLGLPHPAKTIKIYDIASAGEIKKALEIRQKENRHCIPLPAFALKKDFPGYLLDPIRSFFAKRHSKAARKVLLERTDVRPVYSSLGTIYIAKHVLYQLILHITGQVPGVAKPLKIEVMTQRDGSVSLNVEVSVCLGPNIPTVLRQVQHALKTKLELLTGLTIYQINVSARRLEITHKT